MNRKGLNERLTVDDELKWNIHNKVFCEGYYNEFGVWPSDDRCLFEFLRFHGVDE